MLLPLVPLGVSLELLIQDPRSTHCWLTWMNCWEKLN